MRSPARRSSRWLEKRYPDSSLKFKLFYGALDAFLAVLAPRGRNAAPAAAPRRVLIANIAHLGDTLISTAILPMMKEAFPGAKIGFLAGSWSLPVLQSHPLIDWVHTMDHRRLNRSAEGSLAKLRRHLRTRRQALLEIRSRQYDVAVNLYSKPNVIGLLWQAGIPVRIGYISGGLGPLLTHPFTWRRSDRQVSAYHADLLEPLLQGKGGSTNLRYVLPMPSAEAMRSAAAILAGASLAPGAYVIVHMGTGEPKREWPREKWRALVETMTGEGHAVVLTGSGEREARAAELVSHGVRNCLNVCDKLDWGTFIAIMGRAKLVLCVESLASHIASAAGVPCVAVWSGITDPAYFRPLGEMSLTLTARVPCLACHLGCKGMECVRNVEVSEVAHAARALLAGAKTP